MDLDKSVGPVSAFSIYTATNTSQTSKKRKRRTRRKKITPEDQLKPVPKPKPTQTIIENKETKRKAKKLRTQHQRVLQHDSEEEHIPQLVGLNAGGVGVKFEHKPSSSSDENPIVEASELFQWLISPLEISEFFENFWEKDVVHVKRAKSKYYAHILDSKTLDKIVRDNQLLYGRNVDVVSYENGVKQVFNQEGRAIPSALWDYYNNGCSIRVLNPQTYRRKVHLLISTLQEFFGCMVGANVYLTPPGSQGFAPHFDDIEAFIVQLEGRKHWKLYHPNDKDVLARDSSKNFERKEIGDPFMEVCLEAGDILYFPRGTIHEGRTDADAHSLHITISVYQHTAYADLLEIALPQALKKASEQSLLYRKGLPINYLKSFGAVNADQSDPSGIRQRVRKEVKQLITFLNNYIDVDSACDELGRKLMRDSMPPVLTNTESVRTSKYDGPFLSNGRVLNTVEIGLETRIRLVRYYSVRLVQNLSPPTVFYCTENAKIYHGEEEQWLELEEAMVPAVKMLQNSYPEYVSVEELPMADEIGKMQLVSDFWERGLLVTEKPLEGNASESEDAE